jgi:tRNA modification GTPase
LGRAVGNYNRLVGAAGQIYALPVMQDMNDTIAAIATAAGEAGIAIVRISGADSFAIAKSVLRFPGRRGWSPEPNTLRRGFICAGAADGGKPDIDEVIVLTYGAPHSYTREDVVEIQGHGGRACARRILAVVLKAGARPAEPGEFTQRAFLNGRIDLLQAEAVADLVRAKSDRAASAALDQLEGSLSHLLQTLYDDLLKIAAELEASLDFPEEDGVVGSVTRQMVAVAEGVRARLKELLDTWDEGRLLREGALVVICGRPNVGKSTLLNCLLGVNRAIVTDIAGTTRDTIEEQLVLEGIPVRVVDTAGLRESDCTIEQQGVRRAEALIKRADIVLYVVDASESLNRVDRSAVEGFSGKHCVVILNKTDLGSLVTPADLPSQHVLPCCLLRSEGVAQVKDAIVEGLGTRSDAPPHATISTRHRTIIQSALDELNKAIPLLSGGREDDVVLAIVSLRASIEQVGLLTGRAYTEELLDSIFGRFCVGK